MEACGSAHEWGRRLEGLGHAVKLLPAQHVRAYVRRNKTDTADAAALIEASRCADIRPAPVETVDQQVMQQLHRLREQYKRTRHQRMAQARGALREFGFVIPLGQGRGLAAIREALEAADNGLPDAMRPRVAELLEEIERCRQLQASLEREIDTLGRDDDLIARWREVPGVGRRVASATRASPGELARLPTGRHFASSLGVTPREHSSGERRRLGGITKCGDRYLRTLLVQGAQSALLAAHRAERTGRSLDELQRWVLETERRCGRNKAVVAYANRIARIMWAIAVHERRYDRRWRARRAEAAAA